jgi:hypothetical protein
VRSHLGCNFIVHLGKAFAQCGCVPGLPGQPHTESYDQTPGAYRECDRAVGRGIVITGSAGR